MIIRKVDLEIDPRKIEEFEKIFTSRNPALNKVQGCHRVELIKHPEIEFGYSTLSMWDSEDDLNSYRNSVYFCETWKMLKPLFTTKAVAVTYELIHQSIVSS